jgi:hypothetical protein
MGREQLVVLEGVQRVDDEHVRRRRVALGGIVVDPRGEKPGSLQRVGQPVRVAADLGADSVGLVFARAEIAICTSAAASGARIIIAISPIPAGCRGGRAEEKREIGQHGNRAGEGRGHGHDQRVVVADMRQLMRHDRRHLLAESRRSRPVVAATAALSGLRPVAKALGWSASMM